MEVPYGHVEIYIYIYTHIYQDNFVYFKAFIGCKLFFIDADCVENDTHFSTNDLDPRHNHENNEIGGGQCDSVEQCQHLCRRSTKDCNFFTYDPIKKYCWLRKSNVGRRRKPGNISGTKFCHIGTLNIIDVQDYEIFQILYRKK